MTLSYDIARCAGTDHWLCQSCRRTEDGRTEWLAIIGPAVDSNGCPNHIPLTELLPCKN